jgi:Vitamin K-dependent gamma-carboxylase
MNPIKAWNRFFFGPISAKPLGAFRIVFGVILLCYLALMTVEFDHWYTGAGLLQGTEAREAAGSFRFSPLQYVADPMIAHLFLAFTFAVAIGFTLGWRTRLMSVLLYLCMISLYHRNVSSNGGPDAVPSIMTFYMMLCPSGAAYSLDARRAAKKRGTAAEPLIIPWAQRLLQMQICLIYFQSTIFKCRGALWLNGTSIHYILFLKEFRELDMEWLANFPLVINVMTQGAILFQFALAFWLWFKPTRRWAILAGLILHVGLKPILNIPAFGETMVATYLTFLAPDELDGLLRFVDPRTWLARLGVRRPSLAFWGSGGGGRAFAGAGYHQLEFPFESGCQSTSRVSRPINSA